MKKLVVIALFTVFMANAQIEFRPGIRAGLNMANLTNYDSDAKTDFHIGATATITFASFYNLQPEISYSRQGAKLRMSYDSGFLLNDNNLEINYLTVALANKFFPMSENGFHFIIGPSFDFKVSDNFGPYDEPVGFDFALMAGLGYEFPFGLGIDVRYRQGVVDIYGENIGETVNVEELYLNKVVQFGVSYQFSFN